jgi:hypothetical protein
VTHAQQLQDDIAPIAISEAQYQHDLETLDRIEAQRQCFFDVMGELRFDAMQCNKSQGESFGTR